MYSKAPTLQTTLIILTSLPSYMFYVILIAWFIYEIVNDVAIAKRGRGILFTHKKVYRDSTDWSMVPLNHSFLRMLTSTSTLDTS